MSRPVFGIDREPEPPNPDIEAWDRAMAAPPPKKKRGSFVVSHPAQTDFRVLEEGPRSDQKAREALERARERRGVARPDPAPPPEPET